MAKGGKLTASQRKFKTLYLEAIGKTGQRPNAAEILLRAGYSEKTAYHKAHIYLHHPLIGPDIEAALQEAERRARKKAIVTREELLEILSKQARGEEPTEIHVTIDPAKGKVVKHTVRKTEPIDKLCRMNGYYAAEKQDVTNRDASAVMTEEEL